MAISSLSANPSVTEPPLLAFRLHIPPPALLLPAAKASGPAAPIPSWRVIHSPPPHRWQYQLSISCPHSSLLAALDSSQQQACGRLVAAPKREHQRSAAAIADPVRCCPCFQQQAYGCLVPVTSSAHQRGPTVVVRRFRLRTRLQQQAYHLRVTDLSCAHQRCPAGTTGLVHRRPCLLKQAPCALLAAEFGGHVYDGLDVHSAQ
eukprot:1182129-Prorocentrum_minimum.AAC.1